MTSNCQHLNHFGRAGLLLIAVILGGCPAIENPTGDPQTDQTLPDDVPDLEVAIEGQGSVDQSHDGSVTTLTAIADPG